MTHYLYYWKPVNAQRELVEAGPFNHTAGNQMKRVKEGDTVWICTLWHDGTFALLGRIRADVCTDRRGAARVLGVQPSALYEATITLSPSTQLLVRR